MLVCSVEISPPTATTMSAKSRYLLACRDGDMERLRDTIQDGVYGEFNCELEMNQDDIYYLTYIPSLVEYNYPNALLSMVKNLITLMEEQDGESDDPTLLNKQVEPQTDIGLPPALTLNYSEYTCFDFGFHLACHGGHSHIVEYLLQLGVSGDTVIDCMKYDGTRHVLLQYITGNMCIRSSL